jgi:hypothetical protein
MRAPAGHIVAMLAVGLALVFPAIAPAAQTIGQTGAPDFPCSNRAFVQRDLTSGPSYSPSSYGVITAWSAQANDNAGQTLQLAVFRQDSGVLQYTILRRDSVRTLANLNGLNTYTGLRLPIDAGQLIGVYQPPGSTADCEFNPGGGNNVAFSPLGDPPDNVPTDYDGLDSGWRVNAQAVVEPDADRDVFGDETQDRCVGTAGPFSGCPSEVTLGKPKGKKGKIIVTATVPGAGTLRVGVASDPALATAARGKALRPVTRTLTATTRQKARLVLKLTKRAKKKLQRKGKLGLKIKAVYTPSGGPPSSTTRKARVKSKRRR